jgi:hypothetical protein
MKAKVKFFGDVGHRLTENDNEVACTVPINVTLQADGIVGKPDLLRIDVINPMGTKLGRFFVEIEIIRDRPRLTITAKKKTGAETVTHLTAEWIGPTAAR